MKRALAVLALLATSGSLFAQSGPPAENRYDIVAKVFRPFFSVLLAGGQDPDKAMSFRMVMTEVTGRLPKEFKGATLEAAVQFPNKVKLSAPVLGEQVTVCRNGQQVWAVPGEKIEYLLKQFSGDLPKPTKKTNTPLFLPVTAQQAVFLPALFVIADDGKRFEDLDGEPTRVISGTLMPELAKATKAEDFKAELWVAAGYVPRQIKITRRDFTATIAIKDLQFAPKLPGKTWQPPVGVTDIYRTTPDVLEQLLFVVMNSVNKQKVPAALQMPATNTAPQQP
jgi:outer membrane lipoprotein-sorting protein